MTNPQQTPQPPAPTIQNQFNAPVQFWSTRNIIIIFIAAFGILIISFALLFVFQKPQTPTISKKTTQATQRASVTVPITGQVVFEGYATDQMYIAIAVRPQGSKDFSDVISGIVPTSGTIPWVWGDAKSGKNYEIKATLKVKGNVIQASTATDVSAPAIGVSLTIVSEQIPPKPVPSTVSGTVNVDGYVPPGSVVSISEEGAGQKKFTPITSPLQPGNSVSWSWNQAISGDTYNINTTLQDSKGNIISNVDTKSITAPATGLYAVVASTATPPTPSVTGLSGTVVINGNIPQGSYISLATRPKGTTSFNQVASNISATNSIPWSWNSANSGNSYDVQAYLWVNNQPFAASNVLTVTAPSDNDILTINAQQATSGPGSNTINVSCGAQQNNTYQVTINYNTSANLTNPASYNLIITQASTGTQVLNSVITPTNPTQSQSVTTTFIITRGATYFAQYAYNTTTGGPYTSLSPYYQFSCN